MTDLAEIKKRYPFIERGDLWQVIALAEQLQAENAKLKAHNRQMVEGAVFAVAHFELNDKDWNPLLCAEYMEFIAPLQKALQTPSAKLALAEAEVLRAAEYLAENVDNELEDIVEAVEAMQEARKDDH